MAIRKRGKRYFVTVDTGVDFVTGKRRRTYLTCATRREAEREEARLKNEAATGYDVEPSKLKLGEYLLRWLESYARPNVAASTFARYEQIVRVHLIPRLGAIPLAKLRPVQIQEAYGGIRARGLSSQTALHCHHVLRQALQHAMRLQMVHRNVADAVEAPRVWRPEIRAPEAATLRSLLEAAENSRYGALVHLAVMTGLRQGELLGLRWRDIDLEGGTLQVRQTVQWVNGKGLIFSQPKTYGSRRAIPVSAATIDRLQQQRRQQLEERLRVGPAYRDHDLVFATPLGTPIDPRNFRHAWQAIVKAAKVGSVRFHDLRHGHATLLLAHGVHPKVVSERLGHARINLTMDTYSHVLPNLQQEAAEVAAGALLSASGGS